MPVPKRIATAILNSLKGGVVPRIGLGHIAVGRTAEIGALLHDVDMIEDGGAAFRFIVGSYGSGKSFLLQTIKSHAMDRGFVALDADLSPERRLCGAKGQGLATYRELMQNMSVKTRPEGGALPLILEKWLSGIQAGVMQEKELLPEDRAFRKQVEIQIYAAVSGMEEMAGGFEFAKVAAIYFEACLDGDDGKKSQALKWFRGEYQTKREARAELGVAGIISDENWYDYLKVFAAFMVQAGYKGMLILIDELINIYKVPNAVTRQYNYEKILSMYNDVLQGKARYIGILMCGTPQCLEDGRRGIYSYEALRSRLADGRFASRDAKDLLAPVIRLAPLSYEEMVVLVEKLLKIHAELYNYEPRLSEKDLVLFVETEFSRVGASTHITPREMIRDFIELMNILYQYPEKRLQALLAEDSGILMEAAETEDDAVWEISL